MLLRVTSIVLALVSISSCATVPNTSIENMEGEIPEGSGLVIAETVTNGDRIVGPVRHWTEIILWRDDAEGDEDTISIESLSYSLSTQAYMGLVPAGTYRVGALYAFLQLGEYSFSAHAIAPPAIGTFEVKADQVTNLGTILYQPFQDRHFVDTQYPDYAMSRIPNDGLWQIAQLANPVIAAQFGTDRPVLSWNPDDYEAVREETARMIKEASFPAKIRTLPDGSMLMTGPLGGLQIVSPDAVRNLAVDSHYKITNAVELPGGQFLFGGELGLLGLLDTNDLSVRYIPVKKTRSHILDIELGSNDQAYIAVFTTDGYDIYRYDGLNESLSLSKSLPKKKIGFIERGYLAYSEDIRHPVLVGMPNGVAVYFEGAVYRYDESTGQWSESDAPEFDAIFRQTDGYLSGIPYSSWSGTMPPRYSANNGISWTETEEKGGLMSAWTEPTYRFADGEYIRTGEDSDTTLWKGNVVLDEIPVLLSQDNGATWTPVGTVPRGCVAIAAEASTDELVLIMCTDGGMMSSSDRGNTWQQYLAPRLPDFDAFPAGLKVRYDQQKLKSTAPLPPVNVVN